MAGTARLPCGSFHPPFRNECGACACASALRLARLTQGRSISRWLSSAQVDLPDQALDVSESLRPGVRNLPYRPGSPGRSREIRCCGPSAAASDIAQGFSEIAHSFTLQCKVIQAVGVVNRVKLQPTGFSRLPGTWLSKTSIGASRTSCLTFHPRESSISITADRPVGFAAQQHLSTNPALIDPGETQWLLSFTSATPTHRPSRAKLSPSSATAARDTPRPRTFATAATT